MRALSLLLLVVSCTKPTVDRATPDPTDASPPEVEQLNPVPVAPVDAKPTAWMIACKKELELAVVAAGKHSPTMAAIAVESTRFDDGNGAHVEELSLGRLGFSLHVSRRNPPEVGSDTWGKRAESLHGAYHLSLVRGGPKGSSFVSFDGVPMNAAVELAPIFSAAADRCL